MSQQLRRCWSSTALFKQAFGPPLGALGSSVRVQNTFFDNASMRPPRETEKEIDESAFGSLVFGPPLGAAGSGIRVEHIFRLCVNE